MHGGVVALLGPFLYLFPRGILRIHNRPQLVLAESRGCALVSVCSVVICARLLFTALLQCSLKKVGETPPTEFLVGTPPSYCLSGRYAARSGASRIGDSCRSQPSPACPLCGSPAEGPRDPGSSQFCSLFRQLEDNVARLRCLVEPVAGKAVLPPNPAPVPLPPAAGHPDPSRGVACAAERPAFNSENLSSFTPGSLPSPLAAPPDSEPAHVPQQAVKAVPRQRGTAPPQEPNARDPVVDSGGGAVVQLAAANTGSLDFPATTDDAAPEVPGVVREEAATQDTDAPRKPAEEGTAQVMANAADGKLGLSAAAPPGQPTGQTVGRTAGHTPRHTPQAHPKAHLWARPRAYPWAHLRPYPPAHSWAHVWSGWAGSAESGLCPCRGSGLHLAPHGPRGCHGRCGRACGRRGAGAVRRGAFGCAGSEDCAAEFGLHHR